VEVVRAISGALPLEKRLSGTVRAENQIVIYSEIAAPVVRVVAEDGDYVRQGQPLAYLRDTEYREQLRQAEASLQAVIAQSKQSEAVLNEVRGRLERTRELAAKQFLSEQELQAIEAQVNSAEASYQQAQASIEQARATVEEREESLRRTVVRAPISGHVGQRNVEVGMRVDTGTRLYTMGDLTNVRVSVAITDEMLGQISEGQTALISAPSLGERFIRAEVSRISPFLQAGSFSADADIDVSNEEGLLRPGMFVTVDIHYGESQQATLIPMAALYEDPNSGATGVFTAPLLGEEVPVEMPETFDEENPPPISEPTLVTFQPVNVLAQGREMAGVQGVGVGEWVVTVGQNLLSDRQDREVEARARPVPWERVVSLQRLQDQDLLREFMRRQQEAAADFGNTESGDSAARDTTVGQIPSNP
jgi:RND family efflux transporter MFP subunit